MKEELNIAEILKDKPQGTKLYDLLYNVDVELDTVSTTDTETVVWCTNETDNNTTCHRGYSRIGTVRGCPDGLQILLPSKGMRDWSKFAWKKGDVLISNNGNNNIIFIKFTDDTYTHFKGKHLCENSVLTSAYAEVKTMDYGLATYSVSLYINTIEKKLGGKLNRETLEIEKPQPEFKDGDIIVMKAEFHGEYTLITKGWKAQPWRCYCFCNNSDWVNTVESDLPFIASNIQYRNATKEEKEHLLNNLHKKGKRWNAEKKVIEDIKKEYQFKPFERVLVRDSKDSLWHIDLYEGMLEEGYEHNYSCMASVWVYCVPYEGNEHLLGTTKDVEE